VCRVETLARDWRKAARFYARFGITEAMFLHGLFRPESSPTNDMLCGVVPSLVDVSSEAQSRREAMILVVSRRAETGTITYRALNVPNSRVSLFGNSRRLIVSNQSPVGIASQTRRLARPSIPA
jgi:hypothetical protein